MHRYGPRHWTLATGLALVAGYVDAVGFLSLDGFFVSFMSGNSTRLAVDIAGRSSLALTCGAIIIAFVAGVMAGSALGRAARPRRKSAVMALVTALLALASIAAATIDPVPVSACLMAAAMGAVNNVFQREGEVSIGVTYMTGTLVKFGQSVVAGLSGDRNTAWLRYLLLWIGLVAGAVIGALAFAGMREQALWFVTAACAGLTLFAATFRSAE